MNVEKEINNIDLYHEYSDDVQHGNRQMNNIRKIKDYINTNKINIDFNLLTTNGNKAYERYISDIKR